MTTIISGKFYRMIKSQAMLTCVIITFSSAEKNSERKKTIPVMVPESKMEEKTKESSSSSSSAAAAADDAGTAFQELNFNKTLVIEGRVEKPQVQFTLLKEPAPEKEIKFEASFMQNILKMNRENTFKIKEAVNR